MEHRAYIEGLRGNRQEKLYGHMMVSGLPCSHAIAIIDHRHEDITEFCGVYFRVQMYRRAYSLPFNPMPDALELPYIVYTTVIPPAARRIASRSKKRYRQT
ncbi:hypothetical protein AMTR_s00021p00250060 [Amborella trichopoda]|uniref:Zinc finger PMZ-type domain-containing protein n=1 Tax=Amborella trichopoda TaxID=13333 RepID=W1Q097_AMBTC|nr:hypothetical protein AMTR_s00021p00250060 [Amborella trichopoda]